MLTTNEQLHAALALGDPQDVAALIDAGADIHYRRESGYDALIDAVHGRDVLRDPRLIELLTLLVRNGVSLTGMSDYGESGVRVLSRLGRFDAVRFLLQAGAHPEDVQMTELIEAIVFGSPADVEAVAARSETLESRDYWERTAWLVAIQTGDIAKTQILFERGVDTNARGRCGKPPLFYAIENDQPSMLTWLLATGADIHQTDDFGRTALATAAEYGAVEAVKILVQAGADLSQEHHGGALSRAGSREVALTLLDAGADPLELSAEGRRAILSYSPDADTASLRVSLDEFRRFHAPRFGATNPERMNNPFWEGMIRSGLNAYQAIVHIAGEPSYGRGDGPTWCARRFGQTITFLEDGRIVQTAGEHEDHYDPDFCIYNDVFVHDSDGGITVYGYPESVFPPTDFHTATLIGNRIYLIGSLGYQGTRRPGETPVYRLDTTTFRMEHLETTGENPGWIYGHRAIRSGTGRILITGGHVVTAVDGREIHSDNATAFILNIETLTWTISA